MRPFQEVFADVLEDHQAGATGRGDDLDRQGGREGERKGGGGSMGGRRNEKNGRRGGGKEGGRAYLEDVFLNGTVEGTVGNGGGGQADEEPGM